VVKLYFPESSDRLPTVNPQAPIEQMRNGEVVLLVEDKEAFAS
jgi:hypothetical protein